MSPHTTVYIDNWNKWVELCYDNRDDMKLTPEKLLSDPEWVESIINDKSKMGITDRDAIFSGEKVEIKNGELIPMNMEKE